MDEQLGLNSSIYGVEQQIEGANPPFVSKPVYKFALSALAAITIVFITGYFFEKGSLAAKK